MGIIATLNNRIALVPEEQLQVAAKAIADHASEMVQAESRSLKQKMLQVGELVADDIERRFTELEKRMNKKIDQALARIERLLEALPVPEVTVEVAPDKPMEKNISYNPAGFPERIIEREAK